MPSLGLSLALDASEGLLVGLTLSSESIVEGSANSTVLGTATAVGNFTGTPSYSITDATGTFQINSSTGVVTVLSNTDLVHATHPTIPITISVSGTTPAIGSLGVSIQVTAAVAGTITLSASQDIQGATTGTAIGTISGGTGPYTVTDATSTTEVTGGTSLQVGTNAPSVGTVSITIHDTGTPAAPDHSFTITTVPQAPTIALVSTSDSGFSNSDNITNVTTPYLDITFPTTPAAGDVVTLKDGSTVVATHTLLSGEITGSTADLALSAFSDGVHSLTAQHTQGSYSSAYGAALSLTIDTTAPTLSSPVGAQDGTTSTQADLSVSTNEATHQLYWVISTSATPPSAAQVKLGEDSTGSAAFASGNQAVTATGSQTATASGMTNGTYYAYFMQEDASGNDSTVAASSSWTQVVTSGPVLTYQGSQAPAGLGTYSSPLFTSVPIGANTLGANRRALFRISCGASFLQSGSLLTDVLINGVSVFSSAIRVNGTGGSIGSFSGLIIWAWADITDASTSATVDVKASGTNMNGTGAWECAAYTFDKSLLSQPTPTHAEHNVTDAAAVTTSTNTIATNANGFLIGAINFDDYKSPAATSWSVTSSTDTLTNNYAGTSTYRYPIWSKTNGTTTNASDQITWSWTNASQAFSSMLHWY